MNAGLFSQYGFREGVEAIAPSAPIILTLDHQQCPVLICLRTHRLITAPAENQSSSRQTILSKFHGQVDLARDLLNARRISRHAYTHSKNQGHGADPLLLNGALRLFGSHSAFGFREVGGSNEAALKRVSNCFKPVMSP